MKMKHIFRVAMVLALAVGIFAVATWSVATLGKATTEPVSTSVDLREYELDIDSTAISDETIYQLRQCAEAIVAQYDTIIIENNSYVKKFIDYRAWTTRAPVTVDENTITVDITNPEITYTVYHTTRPNDTYTIDITEDVKYLVVLSLLVREYEGSFFEYDIYTPPEKNAPNTATLFVCPTYEEDGYGSPQEYYEAWKSDEGIKDREHRGRIYKVFVELPLIKEIGKPDSRNLMKN